MFAGIAPLAIPQFPLGITYNAARICNLREPVLGSSLVGNIFRNVFLLASVYLEMSVQLRLIRTNAVLVSLPRKERKI